MKRSFGRWRALAGLVLVLGAAPPAPAGEAPAVVVRADAGGWVSLEAESAPWGEVIRELERVTGIDLRIAIPLEGRVTRSFARLAPERAMRRLFGRDANLSLLYDEAGSALPSVVIVFGTGEAAPGATAGVSPKAGSRLALSGPPPATRKDPLSFEARRRMEGGLSAPGLP